MKIKIEKICAYYPYKLRFAYRDIITADNDYESQMFLSDIMEVATKSEYIPILRPMEDLDNKELRVLMSGIDFSQSHIDWTTNERDGWIEKYGREKWINEIPYCIMQVLFKNHYDVFGLIKSRKAISINDI